MVTSVVEVPDDGDHRVVHLSNNRRPSPSRAADNGSSRAVTTRPVVQPEDVHVDRKGGPRGPTPGPEPHEMERHEVDVVERQSSAETGGTFSKVPFRDKPWYRETHERPKICTPSGPRGPTREEKEREREQKNAEWRASHPCLARASDCGDCILENRFRQCGCWIFFLVVLWGLGLLGMEIFWIGESSIEWTLTEFKGDFRGFDQVSVSCVEEAKRSRANYVVAEHTGKIGECVNVGRTVWNGKVDPDTEPRSIMVTSCNHAEGKDGKGIETEFFDGAGCDGAKTMAKHVYSDLECALQPEKAELVDDWKDKNEKTAERSVVTDSMTCYDAHDTVRVIWSVAFGFATLIPFCIWKDTRDKMIACLEKCGESSNRKGRGRGDES